MESEALGSLLGINLLVVSLLVVSLSNYRTILPFPPQAGIREGNQRGQKMKIGRPAYR
jgi:hypothetical protein